MRIHVEEGPRCKSRSARSEQFGGNYAGRPAQSAEATSINWSFEAMWSLNPVLCSLVVYNASALVDWIKIWDKFFGCEETHAQHSRGQSLSMPNSLLRTISTSRARAKQKRTALRMMALSGVIRPSHVELRYGTPRAISSASYRQAMMPEAPLFTEPSPAPSWQLAILASVKQLYPWAQTSLKIMTQLARKPVGPQWTID